MNNQKTLIIIPTFNEADNINRLINTLLPYNVDVLVVDDNSPDGTSDLVNQLIKSQPDRVFLNSRKQGKSGRGSAVLDGIKWSLNHTYDLIFEMDADFSHDPKELPLFFEKIKNSDVVIGSRYLPDSKILNWPLRRRVFSFLANKLAGIMMKVSLSDYTNGYRCYRREALKKLNPDNIPEKGYIVLSYIASQLWEAGCRFEEVPTLFINRKRGASQVSKREVFQALRGILRVRNYSNR